jgi:phosphohistidine phosphatase
MLVGHNPGLEELLVYLTAAENRMPTAAIACVQLPEDWGRLKRGAGQLEIMMVPKALES